MIKYKIDVLRALKNTGFTTYRLRKDKILGEATIQKLRGFELVSWEFQSTLPRGERQPKLKRRMIERIFQSTLPRGERLIECIMYL